MYNAAKTGYLNEAGGRFSIGMSGYNLQFLKGNIQQSDDDRIAAALGFTKPPEKLEGEPLLHFEKKRLEDLYLIEFIRLGNGKAFGE